MTTAMVQRELGRLLNDRYGENEVDVLAFELNLTDISSSKVPKNEKIINLIGYMTRRGQLLDLVTHISATRSDLHSECNHLRQMLGEQPIEPPPHFPVEVAAPPKDVVGDLLRETTTMLIQATANLQRIASMLDK